ILGNDGSRQDPFGRLPRTRVKNVTIAAMAHMETLHRTARRAYRFIAQCEFCQQQTRTQRMPHFDLPPSVGSFAATTPCQYTTSPTMDDEIGDTIPLHELRAAIKHIALADAA